MKLEAEKSFQCSVLSIQFSGKRGALEAEKRKWKVNRGNLKISRAAMEKRKESLWCPTDDKP